MEEIRGFSTIPCGKYLIIYRVLAPSHVVHRRISEPSTVQKTGQMRPTNDSEMTTVGS